eukprot:TRINITY_DN14430_c0_g1_i1.p1 TRINITY_DN14430_c0_g1~~TRINITY_DN14430_c0_g1_i1.p1  ORF type:complete len:412 (+),score=64.77 TRINITY_DN14430_c0_g1_i1:33-1238(+)
MKFLIVLSLVGMISGMSQMCVGLSKEVAEIPLVHGESVRVHRISEGVLTIATSVGEVVTVTENRISSSYATALTLQDIKVVWVSFANNMLTIRCSHGGIQLVQKSTAPITLSLSQNVDVYKLLPASSNDASSSDGCDDPDTEEEALVLVLAFDSGVSDADLSRIEQFLVVKTSPYDMSETPPPAPTTPADIDFSSLAEDSRVVKFELHGFTSVVDPSIFEHILYDHLSITASVGVFTQEDYTNNKKYNYDIMETEWLIATVIVNVIALFVVCICVYWCCLKRYPAAKLNIGGLEENNDAKSLLAGSSTFEDDEESVVIDHFDDGFKLKLPKADDSEPSPNGSKSNILKTKSSIPSPKNLRKVHIISPSDADSETFEVPEVGVEEAESGDENTEGIEAREDV